ncbi:MAG: aldehyde dehydrogenase family protein, partial [Calditrichaeota bacterium]
MAQKYKLMVPGSDSNDGFLQVFAPYDNTLIAEVEAADNAVVEKALATAYKLYKNRDGWLPPSKRIEILTKAAALMQNHAEELALEAAREGGKPLVDSQIEIARAIDSMKSCVETMRTEAGREIPMNLNAASTGKLALTRHEPIGVVVALSAFNHPINLIVHQVGPAIAAGCPVIVKPAETTPLSCLRLVEILREAGLPEEWCQAMVVNDLAVAQKLVTDERVGFLTFIGSVKVGWMLKSKLAPGARCALEHGGAAPVIVDKEADVDAAISPLAKGGLYHAGQVCVSVQRVFVHESIAEEFTAKLTAAAEKMVVGDPTSPATEVGPLIRPGEVDRVEAWVQEAVDSGAKLLCGGECISDSCYKCTILYDPPADAKVSTMEIFGPVICLYPFSDIDDALERANALPYAFQA